MQHSSVRFAILIILLASMCATPACKKWKLGPGCTIRVDNQSGGTMRNLEVSYPGGYFGIPTLGAEQIHMRWVQSKTDKGCHFTVKFEDANGKQYASPEFDFAQACPIEVAFRVSPNHSVTSQVLKK